MATGLFEIPLLLVAMLREGMVAFELIINSLLMIFLTCKGRHSYISVFAFDIFVAVEVILALLALSHINRERSYRFQLLYQGLMLDELNDLQQTHESRI